MTNTQNKLFIAHRGNTNGPDPKENHPTHIWAALHAGFDVEIDVWFIDNKYILGHDAPQYEIDYQFFYNCRFWLHCKNIPALRKLTTNPLVNTFYHNTDDCVLTSQGYIWTYPKPQLLTDKSVAVMPETVKEDWDLSEVMGICTDYPVEYKKDLKFKLL